jgi:hypothetical protein
MRIIIQTAITCEVWISMVATERDVNLGWIAEHRRIDGLKQKQNTSLAIGLAGT